MEAIMKLTDRQHHLITSILADHRLYHNLLNAGIPLTPDTTYPAEMRENIEISMCFELNGLVYEILHVMERKHNILCHRLDIRVEGSPITMVVGCLEELLLL